MSVMEEREPRPRTRRSFTPEFKADAVAMVIDEGRTIADVARSLGIGETNLGNWVRQARVDRGERDGLTTSEREELACAARKFRRCWSSGILVFVYESVASAGSQHGEGRRGGVWRLVDGCGWSWCE